MGKLKSVEYKPKYRAIANHLQTEIKRGSFRNNERLPSLQTLMNQYGVSLSTIRQSINDLVDQGLVTAEHGRGIFIKNYGDHIDTGKFAIVIQGMRLSENASPFHRQGCVVLMDILHERYQKCQTRLHTGKRTGLGESFANTLDLLEPHVSKRLVGVFSFENISSLEAPLFERNIPLVSIGAPNSKYSIYFDRKKLISLGIEYLRKAGTSSIAIIGFNGSDPNIIGVDIVSAKENWITHRSPLDDCYITPSSSISVEQSAYALFCRLWNRPDRPEGILVGDDVVCKGILRAILHLGIVMPDQLKLVSHSNRGIGLPYHLPVTRLEMDYLRLAEESVTMMHKLLQNQIPDPAHIVISPELTVGATA